MPMYTYRCPECGTFQLMRPLDHRNDPTACPTCGRAGRRTFETARVTQVSTPALDRAVTKAGRSAETPEVTRSIPPAQRPAGEGAHRRRGYPPLPRS